METIKFLMLLLILTLSTYIGVLISKKYVNREKDLKEIKIALNMFANKIKFTYDPIPQIFSEIAKKVKPSISNIFLKSVDEMNKNKTASEAWQLALDKSNTSLKKEDIETLRGLGNLLGKLDIEGQINEIELVDSFLNTQIEIAKEDKNKHSKMYKTLGTSIGLAIVIILI